MQNPKKLVIIGGCGHVGLPLGIVFANCGLDTVLLDRDQAKIDLVNAGKMPFMETNALEQLQRVIGSKLRATSDTACLRDADCAIAVLGTPVDEHLNPTVTDLYQSIDAVIAGMPEAEANLPQVPDAPPPPATFEGVPAEPLPTPPPPLPAHAVPSANGTQIFFRTGDAVLDSSQTITVKDAAAHRGKGAIEVEGHGDAASDSPGGQEAALQLAIKRTEALTKALEAQHVPSGAIRISATAFGRGASLRLAP